MREQKSECILVKFRGMGVHLNLRFPKPVFNSDVPTNIFQKAIAAFILRKAAINIEDVEYVFNNMNELERKVLILLRKQVYEKIINENKTTIKFHLQYCGKSTMMRFSQPLPHVLPLVIM